MLLVKIDGEGYYEIDESFSEILDELAGDANAAAQNGNTAALRERLEDLVCLVVAAGEPVTAPVAAASARRLPAVGADAETVRLRLEGRSSAFAVAEAA